MLQQIRFALASIVACAMFAGCIGAPEDPEVAEVADGTEEVGTAEQPLPSSGFERTYYSDSSRTTVVGFEIRDCIPDYNYFDGQRTNFYDEYRWSCPDNPFPFPPYTMCYDCVTWTRPDGSKYTTCTSWACA